MRVTGCLLPQAMVRVRRVSRSAVESLRRQDAAVTAGGAPTPPTHEGERTPRKIEYCVDCDKGVAENESLLIMVGGEARFNGVVFGE